MTRTPRVIDITRAEPEPELLPETPEAESLPVPVTVERSFRWAPVLGASLAGLVTLWAGLSIASLIESLFTAGPFWGWLGAALAAAAGLAATAIIGREALALFRLRKLETLQNNAATALALNARDPARAVIDELAKLYGKRDAHAGDIMDPADRIRLAERELIVPLDAQAHAIITRAVRQVTLMTAVTPSPALDILFVAAGNLRMLRKLAALYGGRPGTLASIRLARLAIAHLAVAGSLALSDQVLQHILGKGLAGRLSARFGEGAVNGILTARLGLAALDLVRPLPWISAKKPALAAFLTGLAKSGESG